MAVFLVTFLLRADDFGVPPREPHISGFLGVPGMPVFRPSHHQVTRRRYAVVYAVGYAVGYAGYAVYAVTRLRRLRA